MRPSLFLISTIIDTLEIVYFIIVKLVPISFKLYFLGSVMVYLVN